MVDFSPKKNFLLLIKDYSSMFYKNILFQYFELCYVELYVLLAISL